MDADDGHVIDGEVAVGAVDLGAEVLLGVVDDPGQLLELDLLPDELGTLVCADVARDAAEREGAPVPTNAQMMVKSLSTWYSD